MCDRGGVDTMGGGGGVVQWLGLELSSQPGALGSVVSSLCGVWVKPPCPWFCFVFVVQLNTFLDIRMCQIGKFWSLACELWREHEGLKYWGLSSSGLNVTAYIKVKVKVDIAFHGNPISELRDVTVLPAT